MAGMSPDELRGWGYYRAAVRSLRMAVGAFLLSLASFGLMPLQTQVFGAIAAALIVTFVVALLFATPLFSRLSRLNADAAQERGGHQIDDSLPLLRTVASDALKGVRD
jgi:hypothetical protein